DCLADCGEVVRWLGEVTPGRRRDTHKSVVCALFGGFMIADVLMRHEKGPRLNDGPGIRIITNMWHIDVLPIKFLSGPTGQIPQRATVKPEPARNRHPGFVDGTS